MGLRAALQRLDRFQQRHVVTALPVAVALKFSEDRADSAAVIIAYWAFFSVFPLLLAFVSILGFLLHGNPDFQHDVLDSTLAHLPVVGDQIRSDIHSLEGNGLALAVGIVGSIWAGLGVMLAIGQALDEIWGVRRLKRSGFIAGRLRAVALLAVFGAGIIASTAVVNFARTGAIQPALAQVVSFLASVAVDFGVFLISFRVMTSADVTARQIAPGAVLATVLWLAMQTLGGLFVEHTLANASPTYGAFASVIGLLTWLLIAADLVLLAAEVNVVLAERLWPRSPFGAVSRADRRALTRETIALQRHERQQIEVSFDPPEEEST
jgi:membrane protein